MPLSRGRKKKTKKKGPTPKGSGMDLREMRRLLDILEQAEQEYINQQNEENESGS